jgi:hypothetical protein
LNCWHQQRRPCVRSIREDVLLLLLHLSKRPVQACPARQVGEPYEAITDAVAAAEKNLRKQQQRRIHVPLPSISGPNFLLPVSRLQQPTSPAPPIYATWSSWLEQWVDEPPYEAAADAVASRAARGWETPYRDRVTWWVDEDGDR